MKFNGNQSKSYDKVPIGIEQRPPHDIRYEINNGKTSLLIRRGGGYTRQLIVNGLELLTTGTELDSNAFEQPTKIDAAHTMLPAGPAEVGPQHGPSRYLDYEIEYSTEAEVALRAKDPLLGVGHRKSFSLLDKGLEIVDQVERLQDGSVGLSLGEHLYFNSAEEALSDINLINEDGTSTRITGHTAAGEDFEGTFSDALDNVRAGNAVFFENFPGLQIIQLPNLGKVKLSAASEASGQPVRVILFMWHRPGSNTICFEPVTGVYVDQGKVRNDGIEIQTGETLTMHTKVELIQ